MQGTVQRLGEICDSTTAVEKMAEVSEQWFHVQSDATDRLTVLEETTEEWEEYDNEIANLGSWVDHAKTSLKMRDTSVPIHEQVPQLQVRKLKSTPVLIRLRHVPCLITIKAKFFISLTLRNGICAIDMLSSFNG